MPTDRQLRVTITATTDRRELRLEVVGVPQPKGSTRAFVPASWARAAVAQGKSPRAVVTSDNPKGKGWEQSVRNAAAIDLLREVNARNRFETEAVEVEIDFYLPRPQYLLTKRKAPIAVPHTKKPDLDKLARNCQDALTGVVWTDDAQVTSLVVRKHYCAAGELPRAFIRVREAAL
jgi:Holliday junction resolvase RusA-like endonuclease